MPARAGAARWPVVCSDLGSINTTWLRTQPHVRQTTRSDLLCTSRRHFAVEAQRQQFSRGDNVATAIYATAWIITILGFSYAAVPLYRAFCQATGYGGTVNKHDNDRLKVEDMIPVEDREITIKFNADTSATMRWSFKPQQKSVKVVPGETALAFYTARNPTDEPITGISTYNVIPFEAGQYFNKIQCFCFEEQRLNPNEEIDMPVFFYIDPEFAEDPNLMRVNDVTLSYTFFKSSSGYTDEDDREGGSGTGSNTSTTNTAPASSTSLQAQPHAAPA